MPDTPIPDMSVREFVGDRKCLICEAPLGDPEIALNRPYHYDCQKCHFCGSELPALDQIMKCLSQGRKPAHDTCFKNSLFLDFKNKTLPVTQAHVDSLNDEILRFYPAVDPSVSDVDVLYKMLMSLQVCAANVSYALGLTKDKLLIRESRNYDHQVRAQKIAKAKDAETEQKEVLAKQAKTAQLAAERENPMLRARRKALEGCIKMGMSQAEAEAWLASNLPQKPTTDSVQ